MPREIPLTEVPNGEMVLVKSVAGGEGVHDRLRALGIRPGVRITKVSGLFGRGPTVVRQGQTQTALGHGISVKILVEVG